MVWKSRDNHVRCTNHSCRYTIELREGPGGMLSSSRLYSLFKKIETGEVENNEALKYLNDGYRAHSGGIYLCETCKEFCENNIPYFEVDGSISPFGTYRCDYKFPFGLPQCEDCGSTMVFIPNIRSSKVKCPKCGSDLMVKSRRVHRD